MGLGGVLLANMLEGWLDGIPTFPNWEVTDEPQDYRTSPEQTGLHLFTPVDAGSVATIRRARSASMHCERRHWNWAGANPDPHSGSGPGQDGHRNGGREDFKTLVADVSMGQVGAVFALEVSRLARSNLDWHRLLELCALTETW